jgi:O-acetyl-ADP-ribose deacetylase (regulator of RNase III)
MQPRESPAGTRPGSPGGGVAVEMATRRGPATSDHTVGLTPRSYGAPCPAFPPSPKYGGAFWRLTEMRYP